MNNIKSTSSHCAHLKTFCLNIFAGIGIALYSMCAIASSTPVTKTMVTITNGEFEPYLSAKLPDYGFASKIVTEAFKAVGITVKYEFYPWSRGYDLAASGSVEGTALWLKTEEREKLFYFSDPVVDTKQIFFHLKSHPFNWNTFEDLKSYSIGVTQDYSYGLDFKKMLEKKELKIEQANTDLQNFNKLLSKFIDIFPIDYYTGMALIHTSFNTAQQSQFTYHPKPINSSPIYLLLSKKNPENEALTAQFNQGLQIIKNNGLYDKVLKDQENLTPTQ